MMLSPNRDPRTNLQIRDGVITENVLRFIMKKDVDKGVKKFANNIVLRYLNGKELPVNSEHPIED